MKIGFITYEFPPDTGKGGIGTYTQQTASLLARKGHEVHVFAGTHYREVRLQEADFTVHRILCTGPHDFRETVLQKFTAIHQVSPFDLIESPEIHGNASEIKKAHPTLHLIVRLHAPNYLVESLKKTYTPFANKIRFVLGALRRGRIDLGFWRKYNYDMDPDYLFVLQADRVTAPSAAMKEWATRVWKIPANHIDVLPNYFLASPDLTSIPVNNDQPFKTIIFFGRLNVLKGLVNATKAVKKILLEFPDWHFKVIGDDSAGPITPAVSMKQWMQANLKIVSDQVRFYEGVAFEELPALLREGEIVLLPSLFESFSYTCCEAMAAGKAIVGSKVGGMNDLLAGSLGELIDPRSVQDIYRALKRFISDKDLAYQVSISARNKINTLHHQPKICEYYEHL